MGAHLQRHLHSDSSLDDASTVGHVGDLLQDLQLEFWPEAVNEEVGSEHIWGDVNHALNLVEISDEAVHTLGHFLLCLALLMVCAEGPKVFRLVLVIQESLEGSPGHVSLTGGLKSGPHFLRVTFHVVDCVHDPLLVFMISDWLEGEEVFATPDEHLEHFLVLAGVLLRVVERVVRFLGDCVGDVGVLWCGFGQHGVTREGMVMDDASCWELCHEVSIGKGKLALHYHDLDFHPPLIQLHFQGGVLVGRFLLGELLGRSMQGLIQCKCVGLVRGWTCVGIGLTMGFHKVCDVSRDVLLRRVSNIALNSCWALHVALLAVKDVVGHRLGQQ